MKIAILKRISLLFLITSIFLAVSLPLRALTTEGIDVEKISKLQNKVAKGYSAKFCNGIGMGISKEGATRLTISENKESKFNPALWFELAASGSSNLGQIDEDQLAESISMNIIRDCGFAIGLSGQKGIDSFKDYFILIRNQMKEN